MAVAAKKAAPAAKKAAPKKAAGAAPATITLKHLGAQIAEHHGTQKKQTEAMLNQMIELIVEHLGKGDRVRIGGLGILQVRERAARMGRNPSTGQPIQIAASKKIAFRPAKELKEAV